MADQSSPFVADETGRLEKVLVHRPDIGIDHVTPSLAADFLYDDIIFLPKMRLEHDTYTKVLRSFLGKTNVLEFEELLADLLKHPKTRKEILEYVIKLENKEKDILEQLDTYPSPELALILISGVAPDTRTIFFTPLPNLIFTRDLAVVVNDHLIVCKAANSSRVRESLLAWYIFTRHEQFRPLYDEGKIITLFDSPDHLIEDVYKGDWSLSFEGGDVLLPYNGFMLIGESERSTAPAIERIKQTLFDRGIIKELGIVHMPRQRAFMHLDTIITFIKHNQVVAYDQLVRKAGMMHVTAWFSHHPERHLYSTLERFLKAQIADIEFIDCAGGVFPYNEREQWTDGCNLFALKESVAAVYGRNMRTSKALKDRGYKLLKGRDFDREVRQGMLDPGTAEHLIITLSSSELSRARGGPRCLTMPLKRG